MRFPPPHEGTRPSLDQTGRRMGQPGSEFVLPPPREDHASTAEEVAKQVGEHLAQWGDLTEWSAETVHNQGQVLVDYGDSLDELEINRVMPWAVPTVAPLYQTINRRADASIGLAEFMYTGSTEGAGLAESWGDNDTYLVFLTPTVTRSYTHLSFMVGAHANPGNMFVAIYTLDENRVLTRQGDQIQVYPGLNRELVTIEIPQFIATQGSHIAVAFRQTTGGGARSLLGVWDERRPLPTNYFPRRISARHTAGTGAALGHVINGSTQVDFEHAKSWFIPYVELSEDIGVPLQHLHDPFAGTGLLERPWVSLTGEAPRKTSNGVSTSSGVIVGAGPRVAMYDTPLGTDRVRVEVLARHRSSNDDRSASYFMVRGSNNMLNGVGVFVTRVGLSIRSWDVPNIHHVSWDRHSEVTRASYAHSLGDADRVVAEHIDGVLTVYLNGVQVMQWTVTGVPTGAAGRFLGIGFIKTYNALGGNPPYFRSWTARDLPQANGDDDDEDDDGDIG